MNLYIVTGASRGLGEALAHRIREHADNLLFTLGRAAASETHIPVDLADPEAVAAACNELARRSKPGTYAKAVLFNNAGAISPVGPLERLDAREVERNLQVNLVAPMLLMGGFLRATAHVELRRIVNISSGAGRRPIFGWGAYCAAKAGLDMASRVAALEADTRGQAVEVCSLAPGVIDTGMQAAVRGASSEDFVDVERFRAMKADGTLRPAGDVAADILRLEAAGKLKAEALLDLRQIA